MSTHETVASLPTEGTPSQAAPAPTTAVKPRPPGVAPVKPEYIVSHLPPQPEMEDSEVPTNDGDNESGKRTAEEAGLGNDDASSGVKVAKTGRPSKAERKERRGQNKASERPREHVKEAIQLCSFAAVGGQCTRPNCRFEHDPAIFLAARDPDLPGVCPTFAAIGKCPLELVKSTAETNYGTKNSLRKEVQVMLRKKQVKFPKTKHTCRTCRAIPMDVDQAEPVKAIFKIQPREKKRLDFRGKTYLAPLTTVGNLPFRRVCKQFGVDITIGEMAHTHSITAGSFSEWALLKRHSSEDFFGVQVAGGKTSMVLEACELINEYCDVDFVDLNLGCPIDSVYGNGCGSALMDRPTRIREILRGMDQVLDVPVTAKIRMGVEKGKNVAHKFVPQFNQWGIQACTLHGRSRSQRYKHLADWDYINQCAALKGEMAFFGNGDMMCHEEYYDKMSTYDKLTPWIFTEIKERRIWDISSRERLDMLKDFTRNGLEHWGTDTQGVNTTRRFLLEFLSFTHRYIPVGLLEVLPQRMNERPPSYVGRDDLETLMASGFVGDWIKISEMLLGPVPEGFKFLPKHKANSYEDPTKAGLDVSAVVDVAQVVAETPIVDSVY
ncbi:hypothetical protein BCR44DRAFT_1500175 [Catenaria anguillulae PL171]|uniref:tRNA-dihydrouridine(47) synthase [NAD(P)(+)] n=1 Tax=Catenaria anguillulae PL171 TaxID=765915 RepID=A0A1Y2HNH8_9FUNG|nr:hypothetical protein BCR44DRAFT_1500175 [Catenaria anguillulae PL171]